MPGYAMQTPRLDEAIALGCVPVFVTEDYSPPFDSTLDWSKFSVTVSMEDMGRIKGTLEDAEYVAA